MHRDVEPELLDTLPASDPRAIRSRMDLRRINAVMGHARLLTNAFYQHLDMESARTRTLRVCELGAGDGTLLLKLARTWSSMDVTAEAEIIDRHYLVSEETRRAFVAVNWSVAPLVVDVMTWLKQPAPPVDVMFANLFLHHFEDYQLRELLRLAAAKTNLFIACEPRRSAIAFACSHLLGLIGCNSVTRHDAPISVQAGFVDNELTALWPRFSGWQFSEGPGGMFSHCFVARRYG